MTDKPEDLEIPEGFVLARTTDVFDNDTAPRGLLRAHQVAKNVWGRLVVQTGAVGFVFEDAADQPLTIEAGDSAIIPPSRRHHVELTGPATFVVEFYRAPTDDEAAGSESTGLTG